ncbi:MAG: putative selenium-dependent hydroxylase accessory protein YqeC [Syntrophobacterales bacterium]|jgi:probable selenium-dependent hydroxylase accessory protein YqeC|nr:putative selenium-dependent hydroxylase accessory protein YqeC [Syntrophobacterales bacterium]
MWLFRKTDPSELLSNSKYVSIVGAGGKTTLMEYSARGAVLDGRSVAVTTTTKIYATEPYVLFEDLFSPNSFDNKTREGFLRIGKTLEEGKLTGLSFSDLQIVGSLFDLVLIEADGAKQYPLKRHAAHEPVIVPFSDRVFVVAGLDALHRTVRESVFRWKSTRRSADISRDTAISVDIFSGFFSRSILMKNVEPAKCTVILNKYDVLREKRKAVEMAKKILKETGVKDVVIASPLHRLFYRLTAA